VESSQALVDFLVEFEGQAADVGDVSYFVPTIRLRATIAGWDVPSIHGPWWPRAACRSTTRG